MKPRKCTAWAFAVMLLAAPWSRAADAVTDLSLFDRTNLLAWCIVPFDGKKRGPEERAAMLEGLGLRQFAYDYRAEHIASFDEEMEAIERHRINLVAWWFPTTLDTEAKVILNVLSKHHIKAQLWVTGGGESPKTDDERKLRVQTESARIKPIAEAASRIGCSVALYNHGGWFGQPENQIEIILSLKAFGITNVGIVYNLHHGHEHLERFAQLLQTMRPHLLALNLNGMEREAGNGARKILPVGQGPEDLRLLKIIATSGWRGPVGILNHTDEDAEVRLRANLNGLEQLVSQLKTGGL